MKASHQVHIITQPVGDKTLNLGVEKMSGKISRLVTIEVILIYNKTKLLTFI